MKYEIADKTRTDMSIDGERKTVELEAGVHEPKTTEEIAAFELLAAQGIAKPVADKKAAQTERK